jgi:predicted nucleic acid-binding protein
LRISADSSFFVSLYLVDRHSKDAWDRAASNPDVWLTPLNRAEVFHAIYAHVFWQKATLLQVEKAIANFRRSCENGVWSISEFPAGAFERSVDLARQFGSTLGIRTIDSLHVACALELGAKKFWTFDERQAKLAQAVGLDTAP